MAESVNQQEIKCLDHVAFMNCVADCVRHGLTFTADYNTFTIILTGGY